MRTVKDLERRLDDVQGIPFVEVLEAHGIVVKGAATKNKALVGHIVEAILGIPRNSMSDPDLHQMGIEVKAIPLDARGKPRENTKVTALNWQDTYDRGFRESKAFEKLRAVLFVPVVKAKTWPPDQWYLRSPFVWMPRGGILDQLGADYESVRELIRAGRPDDVSGKAPPKGQGKWLFANTAGRNSAARPASYVHQGEEVKPDRVRAWWLRKALTRTILDQNIRYRLPSTD